MAEPLPLELPATPKGYTRRMTLHLNLGRGQGAATFRVSDETGRELPIQYQYDTRKKDPARTGFAIKDGTGKAFEDAVVPTWAALRELWKRFIASRSASA